MPCFNPRYFIPAALLATFLPAASAQAAATTQTAPPARAASTITQGELELHPCHLQGFSEEIFCTTLEVHEDRDAQSGRRISLRIAVMPASSRRKAGDPVFLLAGGPGQAATELADLADKIFSQVRRRRDVVLVDVRGTGGSNPMACPTDDEFMGTNEGAGNEGVEVAVCLGELKDRAEPRFYTSELAADDLDQVRQALGYESVNLWGGSYGTRLALVYLQRHGERVRSMMLDGMAPPENILPLYYARDGQRALDVLIDDCEADPACHSAFPRFRQIFAELLSDLKKRPVEVQMAHPTTGAPMVQIVDDVLFAANIRNFLYSRSRQSLIPYLVHQASAGDLSPFAAAGIDFLGGVLDKMYTGMTYSVLCAGDVARIQEEEIASLTRDTFLGTTAIDTWRAICANWSHAPAPEHVDTVASDIPALLLSGRLDPVTPPTWGDLLSENLSQSLHVVVPGGAHIVSHEGCIPKLIHQFVENGSAEGLDASCARNITRPPFVLDALGTAP